METTVDELSRVRRLAEGVGHHLGTPLSVILGRAEMILTGEVVGEEVRETAGIIKEQAETLKTVVSGLLDYGRRRVPQRSSIDLRTVVENAMTL